MAIIDKQTLANLREDYQAATLDVHDVEGSPFKQFGKWFQEALKSELLEPNAMTVATATPDGRPSARIVLLKGYDERGFVFYTNYNSHKGRELEQNPQAALVFNWLELQRQIRIEGRVEKVSPETSTEYFQSRPKGSQIGAWASPQSSTIPNRNVLETKVEELQEQYAKAEQLPRPAHWGGFRIIPEVIEFWQGRSSRLHDRIQYIQADGKWTIKRLAP